MYSGGPSGMPQTQLLSLCSDIYGKIYIDQIGSFILKLQRKGINQTLYVQSGLGGALLWKRQLGLEKMKDLPSLDAELPSLDVQVSSALQLASEDSAAAIDEAAVALPS